MLLPLQRNVKRLFQVGLFIASGSMSVSALSSVYRVSRPPYTLPYQYVIYCFETLFWMLEIFFNGIFVLIMWKTRTIHQNMRVLVINMCTCYILVGLIRFIILYNHFHNETALAPKTAATIKIVQNVFLSTKTSSEIALLIERVCATKLSNHYEQMQSNIVSIMFLLSCYTYPAITITLVSTSVVGPVVFVPLPIIFDVTSWIFLVILLQINKRSFVNALDNAKLTQRYQIVENLRTLRCIRWFLAYSTISNALTVSWYGVFVFYINEIGDNDLYAFFDTTWYFMNSFSAMLLAFPFLLPHETLRKRFLKAIRRRVGAVVDSPRLDLRNVNGKKLIIENNQIDHFKGLQDAWNNFPGK